MTKDKMVNQVHSPQGTTSPEAIVEEDWRYTLLEQADLDSDSNDNDKKLLSSTKYKQMVIDKPKQFLKEVWELIKQQHALNLAYADLINKHAN
jgi:hypothetical protein